jgi:hypothetical protein
MLLAGGVEGIASILVKRAKAPGYPLEVSRETGEQFIFLEDNSLWLK